ncbi:MAG TPA: precorrin-8X methylmutase [Syntrophomonadaceae bacterium]|nr:precorrin-8X methylmutase [Syntrophomonadaceae bacterium]
MDIIWKPEEIEARSMEIIEQHVEELKLPALEKMVIKRVVHSTGDPALIPDICIHPDACQEGIRAIVKGAAVFTDVNMTRAGINEDRLRRYGGSIHCTISEPGVSEAAARWGISRAAASMRLWGPGLDQAMVVIGNAPTALFELLAMMEESSIKPALLIAVPVGFVGAVESKEKLIAAHPVPYITLRGTRGGSPIAAAIVNALLYSLD